jgi:hypothetical protein
VQRGVDGRTLGGDPGDERGLVRSADPRGHLAREHLHPTDDAVGQHVGDPRLDGPGGGEDPHAVEQPVPRSSGPPGVDGDQRPLHEPPHDVQRIPPWRTTGQDVREGGEAGAVGERREGAEAVLVVGGEQVVAPGEGGGEAAAAGGAAGGRVGEEREPVVEPVEDLRDAQHAGASRGQLDRERQVVQGAAEPDDVVAADRCGAAAGRRVPGEQRDGVGLRQRPEGVHELAVQSQGPLARDEHAHGRRGVEHPCDQRADPVDQVLAVVEDEQRVGAAQTRADVRGVDEGDRVGDEDRDLVRVPGGVEPDQPAAVHGIDLPGDLDGEAGLADARRPGEGHEPVGAQSGDEGGQLGAPADKGRGEAGEVPGAFRSAGARAGRCGPCRPDRFGRRPPGAARHRGERVVVGQHLPFERGQLRAGVDAQLVRQQSGHPAMGRQRVGLPARPVQRRHQQRPQPLAQRVGRDQRLQHARHLARRTELHAGGELVLGQPQARLLQPDAVGPRPLRVAGGRQHLGPEEIEPGPAGGGGRGDVAGPQQRGALVGQPQRLERVDGVRWNGQGVPGGPAGEQCGVAEGPAQLRDLGLQGVPACAVGPQVVDEPVRADGSAGVEGEPDQQRGGQPARHGCGHVVAAHLDAAEHCDREHGVSIGPFERLS